MSLAGQVPAPWALSAPSWERGRGPLRAEVLKPMRDTPRVWGHPSTSQEAKQGERWGGTGPSGPQLWGGLDDKRRLPEAGASGRDRALRPRRACRTGPSQPTVSWEQWCSARAGYLSWGYCTASGNTVRCVQVAAGMLLNSLLRAGQRPEQGALPDVSGAKEKPSVAASAPAASMKGSGRGHPQGR